VSWHGRQSVTPGRRMSSPLVMTDSLAPFTRQQTALLTTYRRDGTPVGTPVHVAVEGAHAYFRTWNTTGKLKRIQRNPLVELAPSTVGGRPTGSPVHARARVLEGAEARHAAQLLGAKYPILHTWLIPLGHRLMGKRTVHLELSGVNA
jgi:PPOX class probable F420-dependent enzyme